MPLSDFGLSQRSQVFQVFGNKRKHEWTENDGDQNNFQVEAAAKRVCPEPSAEGDAMNQMLEINHNSIPQEVAHQQLGIQQDPGQTQLYQQQLQEHYRQQQQLQEQQQLQQKLQEQILQQQQLQQQQSQNNTFNQHSQPSTEYHPNTMVMDLCDETYSNVELDPETQTMYSTMDSDCVPNLQQYGLAFCGDHCVGGDRSPTSGRVRCYCKPSWEGLMEMRPYVSDYY